MMQIFHFLFILILGWNPFLDRIAIFLLFICSSNSEIPNYCTVYPPFLSLLSGMFGQIFLTRTFPLSICLPFFPSFLNASQKSITIPTLLIQCSSSSSVRNIRDNVFWRDSFERQKGWRARRQWLYLSGFCSLGCQNIKSNSIIIIFRENQFFCRYLFSLFSLSIFFFAHPS